MSELEQSLIERAARLRQEDAEREASEQDHKAQQEAEEQALSEKATRMGLEIVGLLRKYNFEPKKIWEPRQVGETRTPGYGRSGPRDNVNPVIENFYAGQGWDIYNYTIPTSETNDKVHYGLHEDGRVIYLRPGHGQCHPINGVEGSVRPIGDILSPYYLSSFKAVEKISSNEFQDGLARLIATKL